MCCALNALHPFLLLCRLVPMLNDVIITAAEIGGFIVIFISLYVILSVFLRILFPSESKRRNSWVARLRTQSKLILFLLCLLSSFSLLLLNGYLLYQGESVSEFQLAQLEAIPQQFWRNLGIAAAKCLAITLVTQLTLRLIVRRLIGRLSTFAQNFDQIDENDESTQQLFAFIMRVVALGAWVIVVALCLRILGVPSGLLAFSSWVLNTYWLIVLSMIVVKTIPIMVDTLDAMSLNMRRYTGVLTVYQQIRYLLPIFKRCMELILYAGTAGLVVRTSPQIKGLAQFADKAVGLVVIYFVARVAIAASRVIVEEVFNRQKNVSEIERQRRLTIAPLIKNFLKYVVYLATVVAALGVIGIDPTPILAGAGILGLAIGFGAQNLVEDIVSGLFILFEDYYLVGDYVAAGRMEERPVEGTVEAIELRTTRLRHPDGQVQIIRNGEIGSVVNYSKQYTYATVDIPLAYEEKLETVYPMIENVGNQLKLEQPELIIESTQIEGLESLSKNLVLVRTITKVRPGQHLRVQRILRKMLKGVFDKEGIELADYEPVVVSED